MELRVIYPLFDKSVSPCLENGAYCSILGLSISNKLLIQFPRDILMITPVTEEHRKDTSKSKDFSCKDLR